MSLKLLIDVPVEPAALEALQATGTFTLEGVSA